MSSNVGVGEAVLNPYRRDGKVLVSKVEANGDLKRNILKAVDLMGGFGKVIEKGNEVLVKPNYNSADTPPASTSPDFLGG